MVSSAALPLGRPSAATDEVNTSRLTPAARAASTTLRVPWTLTSRWWAASPDLKVSTPALWMTASQPAIAAVSEAGIGHIAANNLDVGAL